MVSFGKRSKRCETEETGSPTFDLCIPKSALGCDGGATDCGVAQL